MGSGCSRVETIAARGSPRPPLAGAVLHGVLWVLDAGAARAPRSSLSPLARVLPSPLLSTALHLPSASLWIFLAGCYSVQFPARLTRDKAYDSDALDQALERDYGIELIAPNRHGRKRNTQDRRCLHQCRRRCKVERLFAWLHSFRRLLHNGNTSSKSSADSYTSDVSKSCPDIYERDSSFVFIKN